MHSTCCIKKWQLCSAVSEFVIQTRENVRQVLCYEPFHLERKYNDAFKLIRDFCWKHRNTLPPADESTSVISVLSLGRFQSCCLRKEHLTTSLQTAYCTVMEKLQKPIYHTQRVLCFPQWTQSTFREEALSIFTDSIAFVPNLTESSAFPILGSSPVTLY